MVEFLIKFQYGGTKKIWVNSVRVAKPLSFFNILRAIHPQLT